MDIIAKEEEQLAPNMGWLLFKITHAFTSSLDIDEVLKKVLTLTVRVFDASCGSIFQLDSKGRIIKSILARKDITPEVKNLTLHTVMEKGFGGWVYRHAKADIIQDTRRDSRWVSFPEDKLKTLSALAAPLIRRNKVIGIITLHHSEPGHFSSEQVEFIQTVAGEAAMAIENASLYKKVLDEQAMLKQLDDLKNEFVAHVAHDLKSPLSVINTYVEMLHLIRGISDEGKAYVKEIRSAANRMKSLIGNVLDINRIEMGIQSEMMPVDISEIAKDSIASMIQLAREKNISFDINVSDSLPLVNGSPVRLSQVFANLIGNAIKFTTIGGSISIRGSHEGEQIVISVADTGPGIPDELIPKLFQKFAKLGQKETRNNEGHGLGLAIVKSIIDAHKGDIWVKSKPGEGSIFTFSLPLST